MLLKENDAGVPEPTPKRPRDIEPFARAFLERLANDPQASEFVLGGYFALKHYLDYRTTADIDAWWRERLDPDALRAAREAFKATADEFGLGFGERSWGETVSLEAIGEHDRKTFSFQVSVRSVELGPSMKSPWGNVRIEGLDDNIGAKMNALIARGAPRDFTDIKAVVDAGLLDARQCWHLWLRKNPGVTLEYGKMAVQNHLAAIIARRPLDKLEPERRREAGALREWFRDVFAA